MFLVALNCSENLKQTITNEILINKRRLSYDTK